ncbi:MULTISPECIES: acyl-CoA carboxylase subunit epsilon [unclassified Streptomyces]|uniref:acyl-CoA carboxylase subunit epsilon n=1 Tax=unclassified Streptomyces TaxID=2593676 RepID=UPI002E10B2F4|nr:MULTISPECIES: acyl-CoA carboxylase subunit epsilon [unclassified Streptomyces]WSR21638.1 acyl-CoA carboxylase subunit epsilon [Streptomyces sp. NBC_01205]
MSTTVVEGVLRVEKGHAGPEEVAAITAVLLACAAARAGDADPGEQPHKAGWRSRGFRAPHSWRG